MGPAWTREIRNGHTHLVSPDGVVQVSLQRDGSGFAVGLRGFARATFEEALRDAEQIALVLERPPQSTPDND